MMDVKSKLSKAVIGLIAAGASATLIATQFTVEREGVRLNAYQDAGGVWTICMGQTEGVYAGMTKTLDECKAWHQQDIERDEAEMRRLAPLSSRNMSNAAMAGVTSFCTYNIGPTKCKSSTFLALLNKGDKAGACKQILRWIHDGKKDCRVRSNNCYGQVDRRDQEYELCMM